MTEDKVLRCEACGCEMPGAHKLTKFCGDRRVKTGCSYQRYLVMNRGYHKEAPYVPPQHIPCYQTETVMVAQ